FRTCKPLFIPGFDRQLNAIILRFSQPLVGNQVPCAASLTVDFGRIWLASTTEAIVKSVFLGFPIEALEALRHFGVSSLFVQSMKRIRYFCCNQAIGHCGSRRVHKFL